MVGSGLKVIRVPVSFVPCFRKEPHAIFGRALGRIAGFRQVLLSAGRSGTPDKGSRLAVPLLVPDHRFGKRFLTLRERSP